MSSVIDNKPRPITNDKLGQMVSVHHGSLRITWVGLLGMGITAAPIRFAFVGTRALLFLVPAAVLWIAITMAAVPRAIVLHEHGLEMQKWWGRVRFVFDECTAVYRHFSVQTTAAGTGVIDYTLRLADSSGRHFPVTHVVSDAEHLILRVERICVHPVRVEALRAFDAGEVLSFDSLSLQQTTLAIGACKYRWDDVEKIEVSPTGMWFHVQGRLLPHSVPFAKTPYPFVLLQLLKGAGAELTWIEGFVARI